MRTARVARAAGRRISIQPPSLIRGNAPSTSRRKELWTWCRPQRFPGAGPDAGVRLLSSLSSNDLIDDTHNDSIGLYDANGAISSWDFSNDTSVHVDDIPLAEFADEDVIRPLVQDSSSSDTWLPEDFRSQELDSETDTFQNLYDRSRENSTLVESLQILQQKGIPLAKLEDAVIKMRRDNVGRSEPNRIKCYNFLLRAWLSEGNLGRTRSVFRMMQADVDPDMQSFLLLILYHSMAHDQGHIDASETALKLRATIQRMQRATYSLTRGIRNAPFSDDELRIVEQAVRLVWPNFEAPHMIRTTTSEALELLDSELSNTICHQWDLEHAITIDLPVPTAIGAPKPRTHRRRQTDANMPQHVLAPFKEPVTHAIAHARHKWQQSGQVGDERNQTKRRTRSVRHKHDAFDYLFLKLTDDEIADVVLGVLDQHVVGTTFGIPSWILASCIGEAIYCKYFMKSQVDGPQLTQTRELYSEYGRQLAEHPAAKPREVWMDLLEKHNLHGSRFDVAAPWSQQTINQIGGILTDIVLQSADAKSVGADHSSPAFYVTLEYSSKHVARHVKAHPLLASIRPGGAREVDLRCKSFLTSMLPMLSPPKPWMSSQSTPFLLTPRSMVRCAVDKFNHHALVARTEAALSEVYDALNYLGSCPWQVNDFVFEQQISLFKSGRGEDALAFPPVVGKERPALRRTELFELSPAERRAYRKNIFQQKKERNESISLRGDLTNKMCVASAFRGKTFYTPHNLDFRGRTYTIGPYLSHLGDDKTRSMLRFAEAKRLGESGLRWLKIHTANVCGVDKLPFDDRVRYVDENLDIILDSANDPWGQPDCGQHAKFWQKSENPWQTLAACAELRDAYESGDPENFASTLPVHQDGTCNGLQHYAALGCDTAGAAAVNLSPNPDDRPADVYMRVADRVNEIIRQHAAGNLSSCNKTILKSFASELGNTAEEAVTQLAKEILAETGGGIERKIIKQSVMTSVYGVTPYGARQQIKKQLRAKGYMEEPDGSDVRQLKAAAYLAELTMMSLDAMFEKANGIKRWLTDAARQISLSGKPVQWTTPLNFPVIQQYSKRTKVQPGQIGAVGPSKRRVDMPIARKQSSAFPPNFVHSLDSTHMMMTANLCNEAGVRFVSVHDSYWTHAASIDQMNEKTREAFVTLHSRPIMTDLHEYMQMYHDGDPIPSLGPNAVVKIPPPPEKGDFDLNEVLRSRYFFN